MKNKREHAVKREKAENNCRKFKLIFSKSFTRHFVLLSSVLSQNIKQKRTL